MATGTNKKVIAEDGPSRGSRTVNVRVTAA